MDFGGRDIPLEWWSHLDLNLSGSTQRIFEIIYWECENEGRGFCRFSIADYQKLSGLSQRTIVRSLAKLTNDEFIQKNKGGSTISSIYKLNGAKINYIRKKKHPEESIEKAETREEKEERKRLQELFSHDWLHCDGSEKRGLDGLGKAGNKNKNE